MKARRGATVLLAAGLLLLARAAVAQEPDFAPALGVHLAEMHRTGRGVHYRDLTVGEGLSVGTGFTVTIHYTGWLPDGTQFETSRLDNEAVTFRLGDGKVIRGWEEGLRGMRPGGVRQLVVPARMAYGNRGLPPVIPPNTTLVFEIQLVSTSR
jgi:FKBP-type peptidyl-prolyl cis-trans isomerase FkpA